MYWNESGTNLNSTDATRWQRTSPFAAVFYLGRIVQALARNAVQSLAPLAAFVIAFDGDPMANLLLGGSIFLALISIVAVLRYWFFRYSVTDNSILIRDGIFNKRQLDLAFNRIQAINTRQNIAFRPLGLVTVTFDTAGSSATEGYLPAVGVDLVEALERRVQRQPVVLPEERAQQIAAPAVRRELLRLTAGDLVLIGLSSSRVFLLFALLGPFVEYAEQRYGERIEEAAILQALAAANMHPDDGFLLVFTVVALLVVVLFAISIAGSIIRYHGFTVTAGDQRIRAVGGLLTRHEHSIQRNKVQSVVIVQHAVLRLFRRFRFRARQVASGRGGGSRDFIVPICRPGQMQQLEREIFSDELADLPVDPTAAAYSKISPHYLRSRIALFGVVPAIAALAGLWPIAGATAMLALLWLVPSSLYFWLAYRRFGVAILENGFAFRRGLIGYRVTAWLHRKVQRLTVTQSPFQRRKKLATLRFHLAAGSVRVPFVDHALAIQLQDYVLYRIESSRLAWH